MRELFVETAHHVLDAISDDSVGRAWDEPSVLDQQTVGGLAGHLARGGVWVVDDYLDADLPDVARAESAADYYARATGFLTSDDHRAIRERGAQIAADGQRKVSDSLRERLEALTARLQREPSDRDVVVAGGAAIMALDLYLETRLLEQVVHLDDLARSVAREPWPVPPEAQSLVIHLGVDIGRIRSGATEMIRALYRSDLPPVLPVV